MKKYLVLVVAGLVMSGCSDVAGNRSEVVLRSSVTSVPQLVRVGSDFTVTLTVQYSECDVAFQNIDVKATASRSELTAVGIKRELTGNTACPDILRVQAYDVTIPATSVAGPYTIIARQPAGPDFVTQTAIGYPPSPGT